MRGSWWSCLPFLAQAGALSRLQELYHFPNATLLENVLERSDGTLLLTSVSSGTLFGFDPRGIHPVPRDLGILPGATGATGLAQIHPDVFAVTGGLANVTTQDFDEGTMKVYRVDFSKAHGADDVPTITVAAQVNNTNMLNGMVALPNLPGYVLSVDSYLGRLFRIDVDTGKFKVIWQDKLLAGGDSKVPGRTQLGANGLKIHNGWLYFSNSVQRIFGRVPIRFNGRPRGPVEHFSTDPDNTGGTWADDDFAITDDGTIYTSRHPSQLVKIAPWGHQEVVVGADSETKLYDPSAVTYSRTNNELFVVTDGSVLTGGTTGGQIVRVPL